MEESSIITCSSSVATTSAPPTTTLTNAHDDDEADDNNNDGTTNSNNYRENKPVKRNFEVWHKNRITTRNDIFPVNNSSNSSNGKLEIYDDDIGDKFL